MKTFISILALTCSVSSLCADEDLKKRIAELEKRVARLETLLKTFEGNQESRLLPVNDKEAKSRLALSSWDYSFTKRDFGSYYEISYTLQNNYPKKIKLLDASIQFKDLLGEHIYGIKVEPDVKIDSKGSRSESGLFRINQFMNEHFRMRKMDKKDIVAELVVRKIVFDDNTVLEP